MKSMFREPGNVIRVQLAKVLKGTVIEKVLTSTINLFVVVYKSTILYCDFQDRKNELTAIQILPNIIKLPFMFKHNFGACITHTYTYTHTERERKRERERESERERERLIA